MISHIWGAHAPRVLGFLMQNSGMAAKEEEKVRDDGGVIARTRAACASRKAIAASCCLTK
jgi:hypothetical protein